MGNELLPMTTSSVEMEASAQEARSDHRKKIHQKIRTSFL